MSDTDTQGGSWNGWFTVTNNVTTPVIVTAGHYTSSLTASFLSSVTIPGSGVSGSTPWTSGQTPTDYWYIAITSGTTSYVAIFTQSVRGQNGLTFTITISADLSQVTILGNNYPLCSNSAS